jgi:hypothetical protein
MAESRIEQTKRPKNPTRHKTGVSQTSDVSDPSFQTVRKATKNPDKKQPRKRISRTVKKMTNGLALGFMTDSFR